MTDEKHNGATVTEGNGEVPIEERWPQKPAVDGAVYGFVDPAYGGQMVAMNLVTWRSIINDVTVMKQRLDQLSAENIDLKQGRHPDGPRIVIPH